MIKFVHYFVTIHQLTINIIEVGHRRYLQKSIAGVACQPAGIEKLFGSGQSMG